MSDGYVYVDIFYWYTISSTFTLTHAQRTVLYHKIRSWKQYFDFRDKKRKRRSDVKIHSSGWVGREAVKNQKQKAKIDERIHSYWSYISILPFFAFNFYEIDSLPSQNTFSILFKTYYSLRGSVLDRLLYFYLIAISNSSFSPRCFVSSPILHFLSIHIFYFPR